MSRVLRRSCSSGIWRQFRRVGPVLAAAVLIMPVVAAAQGIAGSVSDDTGGLLPGVTVEVSSPALIEGSRTVFTDGQGNYNAVNLVPGTYSVNFTLPGFSTIIREGVVLTAGFTANIDAEMAVGGIEETITVTGASPLVDVQSTTAQQSLTTEQLETLPTGLKAVASSLIALVPGVTGTADVGGTSGLYRANGQSGALFFHGKSDSEMLFDGMGIADPNGVSIIYMVNTAFSSETVLETSGGNAESKATLVMNLIPEEGGNQFSGMFDARYSNDSLQADNLDQGLMDQGVTFTNEMLKFYNVDATLGGPIAEDKVWFFAASRAARNKNTVPGPFFNTSIGSPTFEYTPDESRKAYRTAGGSTARTRIPWWSAATRTAPCARSSSGTSRSSPPAPCRWERSFSSTRRSSLRTRSRRCASRTSTTTTSKCVSLFRTMRSPTST